jgi:hypothetical protein
MMTDPPEFSRDAWSKIAHCLMCGAMVADEKVHLVWHGELAATYAMARR